MDPRDRKLHKSLAFGGLIGIPGLFLPFAFDYSPVEALKEWELWKIAVPFFLAPFISAGSFRWAASGSLSSKQTLLGYALGLCGVGFILLHYFINYFEPTAIYEWLSMIIPPIILISGMVLVGYNWRIPRSRAYNPVLAMQTAYLSNASICLIGLFWRWQVGAYCVLAACGVYGVQILRISRSSKIEPGGIDPEPPVHNGR